MINLSISAVVYFQLLNLFLYLSFNSMLPYIIIVSILVVYSFDSLNIFKEHFIVYWVKKLTTITNIYVLELSLFMMHSKRINFLKIQYDLISILTILYSKLKIVTIIALDSTYKKFIITRFFEGLIWFNEEVNLEEDDINDLDEDINADYSNNPDDDDDFKARLREFREREHKKHFENAVNNLIREKRNTSHPIPEYNSMSQLIEACNLSEVIALNMSRTEYEYEIREKAINDKMYALKNPNGDATFPHSDSTMLLYLGVMELIKFYRYAKRTDRRLEVLNDLKEMQFHVWARKAPYFYDLETDTFLTNKETRMFYKIRMDQAWEERQLELSEFEKDPTITIMSEEEWEVAVENEIASEIEEINMKYQALRDASIR